MMFPIVVAMAAPAAPMWRTLIMNGSRMIFMTVPIMLPIMASRLEPSERTTKLAAADQMMNGAP